MYGPIGFVPHRICRRHPLSHEKRRLVDGLGFDPAEGLGSDPAEGLDFDPAEGLGFDPAEGFDFDPALADGDEPLRVSRD